AREGIGRGQAGLAQDHRALRIRDPGAVELHTHAPRAGLEADLVFAHAALVAACHKILTCRQLSRSTPGTRQRGAMKSLRAACSRARSATRGSPCGARPKAKSRRSRIRAGTAGCRCRWG